MMKNGNNDEPKKFSPFTKKEASEKSELKEKENLNSKRSSDINRGL